MMSDPSTVPHTLGDKVNIGKGTCSFTLAAGRAGQTISKCGLAHTPIYVSIMVVFK